MPFFIEYRMLHNLALKNQVANIKQFIFDVDGVMTDGKLYMQAHEEAYKVFHVRDGLGLRMLQKTGIKIAVISGRKSNIVTERMHGLGITDVYQGIDDKQTAYCALKQRYNLEDAQIAYMGDDLIDLSVMRQVGLAIAVADAHVLVKQQAHWVTGLNGGCGAVREACEWLMEAQGSLQSVLQHY